MNLQGELIHERYTIGPLLGEGGDALVYRARDHELQRAVAVKVLRPELRADPTFVARFEREARSVARLNHPHIVPVYDYGEALDTYFLVMEYVTGGDLRARLQREAPLPLQLAVRLAVEVADALGAAHAQGIVHRDVKPANILLTEDGHAKVTDFGIAKMLDVPALTATAALLGTPHYLAPEQASGAAITPAADVYLVGLLLYEMLAGRQPFEGGTFVHVALQHLHKPPPSLVALNPAVPQSLAGLVELALAKDPAVRFTDGDALATALRAEAQRLGLAALAREPARAAVAAPWKAARPRHPEAPQLAAAPAAESEAQLSAAPGPADREPVRGPLDAARARHSVIAGPSLLARIRESVRAVAARRARPPAGAAEPVGLAGIRAGHGAVQGPVLTPWARHPRREGARDAYTTAAILSVSLAIVGLGLVGARGLRATMYESSAEVTSLAPSAPESSSAAGAPESSPAEGAPESAETPALVATKPVVALETVAVAEPPSPAPPPSQEAAPASANRPTVAVSIPAAPEPAVAAPERPVLAAVPAAPPPREPEEAAPAPLVPDEGEALAVAQPAAPEASAPAPASAAPQRARVAATPPQAPPTPPQVWVPGPLPPGVLPPPYAAPWAPGLPGPVPPVLVFPAPFPMMGSPPGQGPGAAAAAPPQPVRQPILPGSTHPGQQRR